jgi:mannose-6-phosphate isomerase-like protein (cupin superfamily)
MNERGFSTHESEVPMEGDHAEFADVAWWTLVSGDRTPSAHLTAGVCEIAAGADGLELHRHAPAEVYHFLSGSAEVTIGEELHPAATGTTMYIPGNTWHAIRPIGDQPVRLFYCFPTDAFSPIVYEYPRDLPTP